MSTPSDGVPEPNPGDAKATDGPADPADRAVEASAEALIRAKRAARAKGLRPGKVTKRRDRDVPVDKQRDGRDPRLLGDELQSFVSDRGWGAEVAIGNLIGNWPDIVGPEIAAHCVPAGVSEGVLTVRAESTAWASQLTMLSSSMLARIDEEIGVGTVREIRVLGPGGPSWVKGLRRISDGRGPRDTYG